MSLSVYLAENACPHCGRSDEGYSANITHNLGAMAVEAGIYEAVWHPETNGITAATQLIEPLRKAIAKMKADPERFKKYNSPNGWGLYKHFLPWLEKYLAACEKFPDSKVSADR